MHKSVYIETSIPSFYFEIRPEPEMVARRNWTRDWWDNHSHNYELVISDPVLDELERGVYPNQEEALKLIDGLPFLAVNEEVIEIAKVYIANKTMPKDPTGDAIHLAFWLRRWNFWEDKTMKDDKTISRIRTVRHQISAKFGHNVERLGKYYMKRQARHKNRLFTGSGTVVVHS